MTALNLYQLPKKLVALRAQAGRSQREFAESLSMDASLWCALERGRQQVATRPMLDSLLARLSVSQADRAEWAAAFDHDRVIERLARSQFSIEATLLVSRCLQAALVLNRDELRGLVSTVESVMDSKRELEELASRAPAGKEAHMD